MVGNGNMYGQCLGLPEECEHGWPYFEINMDSAQVQWQKTWHDFALNGKIVSK